MNLVNWLILRLKRFGWMFKDIQNYIFLWAVILKNRETKEWKSFNLQYGWFGKIGTVINIPEEDIAGSDPRVNDIEQQYQIAERMKPIVLYLASLNLIEIISLPEIKSVPLHVSFIIEFLPSFQVLSAWYVLKVSIFWTLALWIAGKFW